jgi:hypothetical protein
MKRENALHRLQGKDGSCDPVELVPTAATLGMAAASDHPRPASLTAPTYIVAGYFAGAARAQRSTRTWIARCGAALLCCIQGLEVARPAKLGQRAVHRVRRRTDTGIILGFHRHAQVHKP